ncbi:hypothetical protein D3C71_1823150 [compost metagenome]
MVSLIGVAASTCAYCGPEEKTSRLATAAIPRAAAIPIPTPANIDLFTGNPPESVTTHLYRGLYRHCTALIILRIGGTWYSGLRRARRAVCKREKVCTMFQNLAIRQCDQKCRKSHLPPVFRRNLKIFTHNHGTSC